MRNIYKNILFTVLLYIFQFLISPFLFDMYYPVSNEAYIIFITSSVFFTGIGFCVVNNRLIYWFVSDILYAILIIISCANGQYGIGFSTISLDGLRPFYSIRAAIIGAIIATAIIILIQLVVKGFIIAYKTMRNNK